MYLSPTVSGNFVLIDGRPAITRGYIDNGIPAGMPESWKRRMWAVQFISADGLSGPSSHITAPNVSLPLDPERSHLRPGPDWVLLLVCDGRSECAATFSKDLVEAGIECRVSFDPCFPLVYGWVPAEQWDAARQIVSDNYAKYLF